MAIVRSLNSRWFRAVSLAFQIGMTGLIGVGATGCGALSALANPKAAFAFNEPAPMSVVIRRAEVASETARHVERLMGETGVDDDSKWTVKTALKKEDAEEMLQEIANEAVYTEMKGNPKLKVLAAEARLAAIAPLCSTEKKYPSLIAMVSDEVAEKYADIAALTKEIAKLKGEVKANEKKADEKGASSDDKEEAKKAIKELEEKISKLEDEYKPKREAFISKLREDAAKVEGDQKELLGPVLVNLKRAVEDAKLANSVALVRYPMATPGMVDDIQATAKRVLGDIIEEQTGHRVDLSGFKPDVKLDGTDVKFSLNGIPLDKLGDIKPEEILEEATSRLVDYAKHVVLLIADASATQDLLSFEADVLEAWMSGMKVDPKSVADAGDDISDLKVQTDPAKAKKAREENKERTIAGHRSAVSVVHNECKAEKKKKKKADDEAAEESDGDAKKKKKKGDDDASSKKKKGDDDASSKKKKGDDDASSKKKKKGGDDEESEEPKKKKKKKSSDDEESSKAPAPKGPTQPAVVKTPASGGKPCDVTVMNGNTRVCL